MNVNVPVKVTSVFSVGSPTLPLVKSIASLLLSHVISPVTLSWLVGNVNGKSPGDTTVGIPYTNCAFTSSSFTVEDTFTVLVLVVDSPRNVYVAVNTTSVSTATVETVFSLKLITSYLSTDQVIPVISNTSVGKLRFNVPEAISSVNSLNN